MVDVTGYVKTHLALVDQQRRVTVPFAGSQVPAQLVNQRPGLLVQPYLKQGIQLL
jgi:hypothetical protein